LMADKTFHEMFPLGEDKTKYRKLEAKHVSTADFNGTEMLVIEPEAIQTLTSEAFADIAHFLRPGHLEQLRNILEDPEASDNDQFVALDLLKNANIAAGGVLRYSNVSPLSMFQEVNTGDNLPAQIDLYATTGGTYNFLFIAKGGGSANKTFLYQQTPAVLSKDKLITFLDEKIRTLGTAACPPYHLAVVIGGTSAELTLKTVKLASTRYLDGLPKMGGNHGQAFRDIEM
jgi:fumarate hydratase class I